MAFAFVKAQRKQQTLIAVFVVVLIVTLFVVQRGFFGQEAPTTAPVVQKSYRVVRINFAVLDNKDLFSKLQPYETIDPLEGEAGRSNPFLPY